MELITRARFYEDVAEEVEYLARKAGAQTALRWSEAVDSTIQKLLREPRLGRPRPDLQPAGIRSWRVEHFRALADLLLSRGKGAGAVACPIWNDESARFGVLKQPALERRAAEPVVTHETAKGCRDASDASR